MTKFDAPKRKPGRPSTGKGEAVSLRLPAALLTRIDAWARVKGLGRSDCIRALIEAGLAQNDGAMLRPAQFQPPPVATAPGGGASEKARVRAVADRIEAMAAAKGR